MKFEATARHEDAQYDLHTLDFEILMNFLSEHEDVYCEVVNGSTGEILCYFNAPNTEQPTYIEHDFELMVLGWMAQSWMEDKARAEARESLVDAIREVCEEFGAILTVPNS